MGIVRDRIMVLRNKRVERNKWSETPGKLVPGVKVGEVCGVSNKKKNQRRMGDTYNTREDPSPPTSVVFVGTVRRFVSTVETPSSDTGSVGMTDSPFLQKYPIFTSRPLTCWSTSLSSRCRHIRRPRRDRTAPSGEVGDRRRTKGDRDHPGD